MFGQVTPLPSGVAGLARWDPIAWQLVRGGPRHDGQPRPVQVAQAAVCVCVSMHINVHYVAAFPCVYTFPSGAPFTKASLSSLPPKYCGHPLSPSCASKNDILRHNRPNSARKCTPKRRTFHAKNGNVSCTIMSVLLFVYTPKYCTDVVM